MSKKSQRFLQSGFTIVELVVVIVVIAILSSISLLVYSSLGQRAKESAAIAALSNAKKSIEIFNTNNGQYPAENSCPADPANSENICLDGENVYYEVSADRKQYSVDIWTSSKRGWRQVVTTFAGLCGVSLDNKVFCLGSGNLTNGRSTKVPSLVIDNDGFTNTNVKKLASKNPGANHVCAIDASDRLFCWGENAYGNFGIGSTSSGGYDASAYRPNKVADYGGFVNADVKEASLGAYFSCAIAGANREVFCWGYNIYGQLGSGDYVDKHYPTKVKEVNGFVNSGVKKLSAGNNHVCVIAANDKIYCWGNVFNNKIGAVSSILGEPYSSIQNSKTANPIPIYTSFYDMLKSPISYLNSGTYGTCYIDKDSKVFCHGSESNYINNKGIALRSMSYGTSMGCGVSTDGRAYCWSQYNSNGRLGTGDTTTHTSPQLVASTNKFSNKNVRQIYTGDMGFIPNSCLIDSDYQLHCWGYMRYNLEVSSCPSDKLIGSGNDGYCTVPVPIAAP